jgi:hypothetical protein
MKFNAKTAAKAGKRSGKARKGKSVIVEGLARAAARVDLSVEALSAARKAGCAAFKPGNRVNIAELESWLLENGDIVNEGESLNAIRRRNILAKIAAERIAHDELAAKYTPAADVAEASRLCSKANETVAKRMLPAKIRDIYIEKTTAAFRRLEKDMSRKTRHEAPLALEIREPSDKSTLDDLRAMLLGWKTKFLELENAIANGEMVAGNKIAETILSVMRHPVGITSKHLDTPTWNAFAVATKEAFARALGPTPLPA